MSSHLSLVDLEFSFLSLLLDIISRGFYDWKYGDRWWYENPKSANYYPFTPDQLNTIRRTTFASVLCSTLDIKKVTKRAFLKEDYENSEVSCNQIYPLNFNAFKVASGSNYDRYDDRSPNNNDRPPEYPSSQASYTASSYPATYSAPNSANYQSVRKPDIYGRVIEAPAPAPWQRPTMPSAKF